MYITRETDSRIQRQTSGKREDRRGKVRIGDKEVQTTMYKIRYRDILYSKI